jgi:hypothetical protein
MSLLVEKQECLPIDHPMEPKVCAGAGKEAQNSAFFALFGPKLAHFSLRLPRFVRGTAELFEVAAVAFGLAGIANLAAVMDELV